MAKRFGLSWALRGIDLEIGVGDSVCLLGPNGSGKTTLLRILATASRPNQGEVNIFGFSAEDESDEIRRRVGLLSHRSFMYGELTALENLRFAAAMYGLTRSPDELKTTLEAVGLGRAVNTRVRGFSQGMNQRLALARATLHDPQLLLLDEPYTALDTAGLRLLDQHLDAFRARGGTMIVVTHQVERGLATSTRAVALRAGRVVYDGPSAGFRGSPEAHAMGDWGPV